jgi:hypothetical protein
MILTNENTTIYVENNCYHRIGGPAILTPDSREWWQNGKPHRDNGPARMFRDKMIMEYWLEGKYVGHADLTGPNCDKTFFEIYWSQE